MKRFGAVTGFLLVVLFAATAMATPIIFTDRSTWLNNVNDITTDTFDTLSGQYFNPLQLGQVKFDMPTDPYSTALWVSTSGRYAGIDSALFGNWNFDPTVRATFTPGTTAVGVDVFNAQRASYTAATTSVAVTIGSETFDYLLDNSYANSTFFGIAVDDGRQIDSISFTPHASGYNWVAIDNFAYGNADCKPVPEPSTLCLLCAGLVGAAFFRMKKTE